MLTAMGDVMREAYKRGWITARDGNISVKQNGNLYITPSAVVKHHIHPDDIIRVPKNLNADECGNVSIEFDMHYQIHQQRNKSGAIVHLHPTYIVAAMHAGLQLSTLVHEFPELGRYTKVGRTVQPFYPGTNMLANSTAENIKGYDIVGQKGHGATAWGKDPWAAFEHIERLEHICQIVLASGVHVGKKTKKEEEKEDY